jgi:hypothetical protein
VDTMPSLGIEPGLHASEACVLSIKLRGLSPQEARRMLSIGIEPTSHP